MRKLHETKIGSYIVYQGDRLMHETDCLHDALQVLQLNKACDGVYRKSGIGRANGEQLEAFKARRARAVAANLQEHVKKLRDELSQLKKMTIEVSDLIALSREHLANAHAVLKLRIARARRLP